MLDDTPIGDDVAIRETLYRAAVATPGLELLLNSIVAVDGDHATVSSISLLMGGGLRDPQIVRCERVVDSLHRDATGHWQLDARIDDGHMGEPLPDSEPA